MAITYSVFWRKYSNCLKIFLFHLRTSGNFSLPKITNGHFSSNILMFFMLFQFWFSSIFTIFNLFLSNSYGKCGKFVAVTSEMRKYNFFMLFVFYSFDFLWFYGSKTYFFNPMFKEDYYVVSHCKNTVKKNHKYFCSIYVVNIVVQSSTISFDFGLLLVIFKGF